MAVITKPDDQLQPRAVGTKVTPREIMEIEALIEAGVYLSVSDFIQEIVSEINLKQLRLLRFVMLIMIQLRRKF